MCLFVATVLLAVAGYVLASTTPLPLHYSTLPTLAGLGGIAGVAHGYRQHTSPWLDFVLAASIAVSVMLGIFAVNYVPGEVNYWPQNDRAWTITKQLAACLFCGFVVGSLGARLVRSRSAG